MSNRTLTATELKQANSLLAETRLRLQDLSGGDPELLFAFRRKIYKELTYDERGKPTERAKLKAVKHALQGGRCAECGDEMPLRYSELDRKRAADGYSPENTELVHASCHQTRQALKNYA